VDLQRKRKHVVPSKDEFEYVLHNNEFLKDVAAHYGVSIGTIYRWLEHYKGKIRR